MPDFPSGTVTFLFTDIEGSTALWERDRAAMQGMVERHLALLAAVIAGHRGVHFKTVGDAVQAAFPTAPGALAAALDAQRALLAETWASPPLRVRMALHAGEAVPDERGDYLAAPLNRLSRLLASGHGGQILLSQAVQQLAREALPNEAELRDLGEHRLRDLLEPERVYQLLHPDLPREFPVLKSLDARPHNLPRQPTPFVGRGREVAEVVARLRRDDVQLVTLTGPGGTGKTRLALQAAADLADEFPDGAFFAPLASVTDPGLVPSAVLDAVGLRAAADQSPAEQLRHGLADGTLLLVLDNCEHVTAGVAFIGDLVADCPRLKVLATSRVPLHLRAEREYPVPPLALPRRKPPLPLEQLAQFEAVRLFIDRAQDVKPDFAIDNANAPAVAEICHRLDGLPLAIELAAARVRLLPPQAMLARLEQRLPLLTGGARDAPARQRTLRDTIAWSFDLLSPEERLLFARLSVFAGGCAWEAAEAVADPTGELDAFSGLEQLVEQNLVRQVNDPDGAARYLMLETVREFGLEHLDDGEREGVQQRHAAYFLAFAEAAEPHLWVPGQEQWLGRLAADLDNIRASLAWFAEHGQRQQAVRLAAALLMFWQTRGLNREGATWLPRSPEDSEDLPEPVRVKALCAAGFVAMSQGEFAAAAPLFAAGVGLARFAGPDLQLALALIGAGLVAYKQAQDEDAAAAIEEAHAVLTAIASTEPAALPMAGHALSILGDVALSQGELDRAAERYAESIQIERALGYGLGLIEALPGLAAVEVLRGETDRAATLLREAVPIAEQLGDVDAIASCLRVAAGIAAATGQAARAARLLGAAEVINEQAGLVVFRRDLPILDWTAAAVRHALPERAAANRVAGRAVPVDDAIADARALLDAAAPQPSNLAVARDASCDGVVEGVSSHHR